MVCLKSPKPTDRSRNSVGSEFQIVGSTTEKFAEQSDDAGW